MRLAWDRTGVVRMTVRIEELAALVAGGRLALAALEEGSSERSAGLGRVLGDFDRAAHALRTTTVRGDPKPHAKREGGGP